MTSRLHNLPRHKEHAASHFPKAYSRPTLYCTRLQGIVLSSSLNLIDVGIDVLHFLPKLKSKVTKKDGELFTEAAPKLLIKYLLQFCGCLHNVQVHNVGFLTQSNFFTSMLISPLSRVVALVHFASCNLLRLLLFSSIHIIGLQK